jgi:PAS domain S-box-containing protein
MASQTRVLPFTSAPVYPFASSRQGHRPSGVASRTVQDRYRALFDSAKDGILILDFATGRIVDANPFMSELLGYSSEEFSGKELWEIGLFAHRSASEAAVRQLQETGYIRFENLPLESSDGRRVEVEVVGNAYEEGEHSVIQCNIRDITERRRLERTNAEQAKALTDLHDRKDEFLAMLSHELRSPLAPIASAVQILRLQPNEGENQRQARGIIERQVGRLKHLIDDLLEGSRFTTGKVHLRRARVTLQAVVTPVLDDVRPLMNWGKHEFTVALPPEPIWLDADAARLEQVIVNLLNNAAKYTDEGGKICLTVERDGDEGVVRVRDTGVGIAPELLPQVFDLFTQAERSLDRSAGGLGIGLCLVRRMVELHGGTVEAHSVQGEGSEFVVRLPLMLPVVSPSAEPPSGEPPQLSSNCRRVLVVDDSVDTAEGLSMLFTASGHVTRLAYDGPTALQEVVGFRPDVVVMDIGLPGLDGYEVARQIRHRLLLPNIVLVAMTGYGQAKDRRLSRDAGFDHHLVKPALFSELQKILATITDASSCDEAGGAPASRIDERIGAP